MLQPHFNHYVYDTSLQLDQMKQMSPSYSGVTRRLSWWLIFQTYLEDCTPVLIATSAVTDSFCFGQLLMPNLWVYKWLMTAVVDKNVAGIYLLG